MKKYVVIVDPYSSGCLLAKEFHKKGFLCIAIHSQLLGKIKTQASFIKEDFIYSFVYGTTTKEKLKQYQIEAILAGAESGVNIADILSDSFGLKGNIHQLRASRTDKYEMQERIKKSGIRSINQVCSDDINLIKEWVNKNQYETVIVKPVSSAGSDNVFKCSSVSDIEKAFFAIINKVNFNGGINELVLVQEFIAGTEYVIDSVSLDGKHYTTNLCEYKKGSANGSDVIYFEMIFLHPDNKNLTPLIEYNDEVLSALGIENGPSHSEVMLTKEGPVLIEVGSRIHGGYTPRTVQNFSSVSQIDLTVDAYVDPLSFKEKTLSPPIFHKFALVKFLVNTHQGKKIEEIICTEKIANLKSFFDAVWNIKIGEICPLTVDLFTSPGWVVLMHEDEEQLYSDKNLVEGLITKSI